MARLPLIMSYDVSVEPISGIRNVIFPKNISEIFFYLKKYCIFAAERCCQALRTLS